MKPEHIESFYATLKAANPNPRTELEYASVFELLAAVSLSAQATDVSVNKATRALFVAAPTPRKMAALGAAGIEPYIKTIGLYRNKAKNLAAASEIIVHEHSGLVPRTREALEALPGVGRKTANVILNTAFGQDTMAVDTHIFRIGNRTGLAPGKTPLEVEQLLLERTPAPYRFNAHHWLILHGRYVCVARSPKCSECGVQQYCAKNFDAL
jgi:endonuclease III